MYREFVLTKCIGSEGGLEDRNLPKRVSWKISYRRHEYEWLVRYDPEKSVTM